MSMAEWFDQQMAEKIASGVLEMCRNDPSLYNETPRDLIDMYLADAPHLAEDIISREIDKLGR